MLIDQSGSCVTAGLEVIGNREKVTSMRACVWVGVRVCVTMAIKIRGN